MGVGLEYMERLSKQQERLKAQRKRIETQRRKRPLKRIKGEDKTAEETVKWRRRGWRAAEPQKETADRLILEPQKMSRSSAKWDRRTMKWNKRTGKHHW